MSRTINASRLFLLLLIFLSMGLMGCDAGQVMEKVRAKIITFLGGKATTGTATGEAGATAESGAESRDSTTYEQAKRNSEILAEVYRVVNMRDPENQGQFGTLVDTLNQGAALEGIYNGLIHSANFRKLEIANPGAAPEALSIFGREMARFNLEYETPHRYTEDDAKPLAIISMAAEEPQNQLSFGGTSDAPAPLEKNIDSLATEYSRIFVGASIYTLKRVLGDEALQVMEVQAAYPEKLARWYEKWAQQVIADYNVDFGLPLRRRNEAEFHYDWSISAGADRTKWEVLNRLHRVLNASNSLNQ